MPELHGINIEYISLYDTIDHMVVTTIFSLYVSKKVSWSYMDLLSSEIKVTNV